MKLYLFSTQGCHLCEQAKALCQELGIKQQVEEIDIAFDDALFAQYGVHIPVLQLADDFAPSACLGPKLYWPFDKTQLQHWLLSIQ